MSLALPDLTHHVALVTGANSGLGFEASKALAGAGARVLMACRSEAKAGEAIAAIRGAHPSARLEFLPLDLASLRSVRAAAERVRCEHARLDFLINNAGVMAIPRALSEDGFEMQLAVNHLGHFALTGLLLPRLLAAPAARVVSVTSLVHRVGRIRFEDIDGAQRYRKWDAYGQSKLANLFFAIELHRRLLAARAPAISLVCHPGYAATNLQSVGPQLEGSALMGSLMKASNALFAQSAARGAECLLAAATSPLLRGGECIGPSGPFQAFGAPTEVSVRKLAHNPRIASRLWALSVERTGVGYEALGQAILGDAE
jgi:NAD(P)-dependent dehydrogenase (short-subunit alcohol dehydrogenase family)